MEKLNLKTINQNIIFFERAIDIFVQQEFHTYLNKAEGHEKGIFEIAKNLYAKEKYLNLSNSENRKAISNLRLSSHKLAMKTGEWYNIAEEQRICHFCTNQKKVETEMHFLFECPKYENLRQGLLSTAKGFPFENKKESLALFFQKGSLKALNIFGKFVRMAFELREQNNT